MMPALSSITLKKDGQANALPRVPINGCGTLLFKEMIRRDYFLRMIEEFLQALSRIKSLKQGERWQEASGTLDEQFQRLIGISAQAALQLSETELLARLLEGEPTHLVRDKTLM